jgi:hypothetical protein
VVEFSDGVTQICFHSFSLSPLAARILAGFLF